MKQRLSCALLLFAIGCGTQTGPIPAPPDGAIDVAPETALAFQERAEEFYGRLIRRRFNALETFSDRALRSRFRTDDAFFDYYADLASAFEEAHFERNRPSEAIVFDFLFGTPTSVLVQVRYTGQDNRPLRPNDVMLIRIDRWDLHEGDWWVAPGARWP